MFQFLLCVSDILSACIIATDKTVKHAWSHGAYELHNTEL